MDIEYHNGIWDTLSTLDTGPPDAIGVLLLVVGMVWVFTLIIKPEK